MHQFAPSSASRLNGRAAFGPALIGLALLLGAPAGAQAPALGATATASPQATVTILDGNALLLRGSARLQLAEGVRLMSQDVVETTADARLARLEFADGSAINLGPATRLLIDPRFVGERGRAARVYLLQGWVKLNAAAPTVGAKTGAAVAAGTTAGTPLLASPALDLRSTTGSVVAAVQPGAIQAFVESGEMSLQERDVATAVGSVQTLRSGEFFTRLGSARSTVVPRPAAAFIQQLPRSFLDTLPTRAALFKDREVDAKPVGELSYADVKDWLSVEPALRRGSMNRWRPLTRNPAFRTALVANMPAHPEWDRVLFPEKYLPKRTY